MPNTKKIAINTIITYVRLFIIMVITLVSTRLVLKILGVEDYGLYNVVGGIVVILNIFCTGMQTTTRRYINVEMGKEDGDVNKVFNICFKLHVEIALIFFIIAEIIGYIYIYNFLNVQPSRIPDAIFIYNISLIVACLGLMNVPFQSTLVAHEKFASIAIIDILTNVIALLLVVLLYVRGGDVLRLYAVSVCLSRLISLALYTYICYKRYNNDVRLHWCKDRKLSKEIIIFNNYITLGAASYITRTQGANIVINYFFNTAINGAYAIAYQIESALIMLVGNLSTASAPQITQNYANGNTKTSIGIAVRINKMSILLMTLICFSFLIELPYLLKLWLGEVPDYVIIFSRLTIISAFIRSLGEGIPPVVQASGKIKWFQIAGSIFTLMDLPIAIVFYVLGFPPQTITIVFCISSLCGRVVNIFLLYRILKFDVPYFLKNSYLPVVKMLPFLLLYYIVYTNVEIPSELLHIIGWIVSIIVCCVVIYFIGFNKEERSLILNTVKNKIKR